MAPSLRDWQHHDEDHHDDSRASDNDAVDRAFIAQLAQSDTRALAALVERYDTRLRDFAYLTVRDPMLAAEAAQDVFVSLWERRDRLVIPGRVGDYLYRAVRNRALDLVRHEEAQGRLRDRLGRQFVVEVPPSGEAADAALATQEFSAAVHAAIESLTPRVREVFLMHRVQGMSHAEIAEVLGLSLATVKSQVSRAAKDIAEYLAPYR